MNQPREITYVGDLDMPKRTKDILINYGITSTDELQDVSRRELRRRLPGLIGVGRSNQIAEALGKVGKAFKGEEPLPRQRPSHQTGTKL